MRGCHWSGLVEKHMVEGKLWYGGEDEKPVMGEVVKGGCDVWRQERKGQETRTERELHMHDKWGAWHKNNNKAWQQVLQKQNRDFTDLTCEPDVWNIPQINTLRWYTAIAVAGMKLLKFGKTWSVPKRENFPCFNTESSSCNTPPDEWHHQGYARYKRVTGEKRCNSWSS